MSRYVEALFRYWIRFAIILVILPVPASLGTLVAFRTVQATTNLWVNDPTYMGSNVSSTAVPGWNQYATPAQNQSDQLSQYLQTQSFLDAVRNQLASSDVGSASQRNKLVASIPQSMHVIVTGSHVLTINFSCDHASYCMAVLSATIVTFQSRLTDALKTQEQLSTSFLQGQLTGAQQRAADSESALEKYLAAHPGADATSAVQQALNPELYRLTTRAQQDRDQVSQLQSQLGQAQFTFAAADRFVENNTMVVDPPHVTSSGLLGDGSSVKRAALVWLGAFGVAAVYLALLVWMDKTARDTRELVSRLTVPILATVPRLSAKETF